MDEFDDFISTPSPAANPTAASGASGVNLDAVDDFLTREAQLGQQLGEDPNNFAAPSDQFTMGTTNTTQVLNNSVSPTTSVTSAVIVDRPPISGGSTAGGSSSVLFNSNQPQRPALNLADSEHIMQWKEKQAARVAQLQAEQKIKQEELLKSARKEIDQFYEEYNQKKAKQLTRNRETEKTFIKTRDEAGKSAGNVWDRVVGQIDFNASTVKKDTGKSTTTGASQSNSQAGISGGVNSTASAAGIQPDVKKDTARFKSILLQLKNDPKAPGNPLTVAN